MTIQSKIKLFSFILILAVIIMVTSGTFFLFSHLLVENESVQNTLALLNRVLLIVALITVIPAITGVVLISKFILHPIKSLIRRMQEVQGSGELKIIELEQSSENELYEMSHSFNYMIDLLRQNSEKQQQFFSDASHELKTPLTIIISYTNLLKKLGSENQEILEESIEAIDSESMRIKDLIEKMLFLAEEQSVSTLNLENKNVNTLAQEVANNMAVAHNRVIQTIISDEPAMAIIDVEKMRKVLRIVVDNAFKYSQKEIILQVRQNEHEVLILITDYGIGIPKDQLDKIFDRFYRIEDDRNTATTGTGLGLPIAQNIVQLHRGKILVDSVIREGSTFIITLPK